MPLSVVKLSFMLIFIKLHLQMLILYVPNYVLLLHTQIRPLRTLSRLTKHFGPDAPI